MFDLTNVGFMFSLVIREGCMRLNKPIMCEFIYDDCKKKIMLYFYLKFITVESLHTKCRVVHPCILARK
jgi:hypothetical protein